jgi:OOP family OmpA-OmpF porin
MPPRTLIATFTLGLTISITAAAAQGLPARYSDAGVPFDTAKFPIARAVAGDFPYLTLPDGYQYINSPQPRDLDRFPFWTPKGFHPVEGRVFMAYVRAVPGKAYSQYELTKRLSDQILGLGGTAVANERIPNAIAHSLPHPLFADHSVGLGDIYNVPVATWVIHRAQGDIWVSFTTSGSGASLAVMEEGKG